MTSYVALMHLYHTTSSSSHDLFFSSILLFFIFFFFFFNDTATTEIYTLSLHDALPISKRISFVHHISVFGQSRCSEEDRHAVGESVSHRSDAPLNGYHVEVGEAIAAASKAQSWRAKASLPQFQQIGKHL